jgi:hypothetical protein
MADLIFDDIAKLEARAQALREAVRPDVADAAIATDLARFDREATRDGIYIADRQARDRYEDGRRQHYDDHLVADVRALETDHAALVAVIATATAEFQRVPAEPNAGLDVMRELAALQRYQGRPLAVLVKAYQATADADNPTLVRLIETDREAFRLTPDPETDVQAVQDLQRAIADRQAVRVPEGFRAALPRARAVLSGLTLQQHVDHLKSGRGVARRPRPTLAAVR